jgi:hypothetical protein
MWMFREKDFFTEICGNSFMVLQPAPPLVISEARLDEFVFAISDGRGQFRILD